jgi:O-antigen/teichoic acid export membrane protein
MSDPAQWLRELWRWPEQRPARAGALAGWFQQGCGMGVALLLIPVVTRMLSPSEAGIWFALVGLTTMLAMLDWGFGFAISRQAAFTLGAKETTVAKDEFIHLHHGWKGVGQLYYLTRQLYRIIAAAVLLAGLAAFEVLLHFGNLLPREATSDLRVCWYSMVLASGVVIFTVGQAAFLNGLGAVYQTRALSGLYQLCAGLGAAVAVLSGGGLAVMGLSYLVMAFFYHLAIRGLLAKRLAPVRWEECPAAPEGSLKGLAKAAVPMGVINASGMMIFTIQPTLVGIFLGAEKVTAVYFAIKLGTSLHVLALQIHAASLPFFTRMLAGGSTSEARNYMRKTLLISWSAALIAMVFFVVAAPFIAPLFIGSIPFVSQGFIVLLAVDLLLLGVTVPMAQSVLASGRNPFAVPVVLTGISSLALAAILIPRFGVIGVPLATLIANVAFHERAYVVEMWRLWGRLRCGNE